MFTSCIYPGFGSLHDASYVRPYLEAVEVRKLPGSPYWPQGTVAAAAAAAARTASSPAGNCPYTHTPIAVWNPGDFYVVVKIRNKSRCLK